MRYFITLTCLMLLGTVASAGAITTGIVNDQTQFALATLYGPVNPATTLGDDSALLRIDLSAVRTYERVIEIGSAAWNVCDPCESPPFTFSHAVTNSGSYSKSFSTTTNATVNSSLSAEFMGIGSGLESSFSVGQTIGSQTTYTETTTTTHTFGPYTLLYGGHAHFLIREFHVEYSGTYDWYEDGNFGNTNHTGIAWSATSLYKKQFEPIIHQGACPCPEPGAFAIWTCVSGFGFLIRRRPKKRV